MNEFREVLSSLPRRQLGVVREHEILRVFGTLPSQAAANSARDEVVRWTQNRCGGTLPEAASNHQSFEYLAGGRNSLAVRLNTENVDLWAIRAEDPDKNIAGRVWTTEVVVGQSAGTLPKFSARQLVNTSEDNLDIEPHSPGLVQQIAENCGFLRDNICLSPNPIHYRSEADGDALADLLVSSERTLPVIALSIPEGESLPLVDASAIARATLGLAHVAIVDQGASWALTRLFGKARSVFGGAVRLYLPAFDEQCSPFGHKLVVAQNLQTSSSKASTVRWLRSHVARESILGSALGRDVLTFSAVRTTNLKLAQEKLKAEVKIAINDEAAAALREQSVTLDMESIKALEAQVAELTEQNSYFSDEHALAEERARTAEEQSAASAYQLQVLRERLEHSGADPDEGIVIPDTWSGIPEWCDTQLAGRLYLTSRARRALKKAVYSNVRQVANALFWLAKDGRDKRINGGDGSIREEVVADGIRNAHCGNDSYKTNWQGQVRDVDWHIKNGGNVRDPERCLRIYYFWDDTTQQIVVDELPNHRRTGAT